MQSLADALPALGIVAAVLGVIKTMGAITEQAVGVAQRVQEATLDTTLIALSIAIGVATSVIAAWIPARSASAVNPVQALQKGKYQVLSAGENRRRRIAAVVRRTNRIRDPRKTW